MSKSRFLLPLILLGPFVAAGGVYLALQATLPPLEAPPGEGTQKDASQGQDEPPKTSHGSNAEPEPSPTVDQGPGNPASHLSGPVGHLDASRDLVRGVLEQAQGHHVFLDLTFDARSFDGSLEDGFFVLWDACDGLSPDEAPSVDKCSGWSIRLDPEAGVPLSEVFYLQPADHELRTDAHDTLRLRGPFRLGPCDGPHQGLMGCLLVPME